MLKEPKIILNYFFSRPVSILMHLCQLKHLSSLLLFLLRVSFGVCSSLASAIGSPN